MSYLETIMEARDTDADTTLSVDTYVCDAGSFIRFVARIREDRAIEVHVSTEDARALAAFIVAKAEEAEAE